MSKFSDFFHHMIDKAKSTETTLVADSTRFFTKVESKLGPVGQVIVKLAVTEAGLLAAPWQVKLLAAVTQAKNALDQHNIVADINDIVAAITVLLDDAKSLAGDAKAPASQNPIAPAAAA